MPESMKKRLGEMLVDEGIISEEQLQEAMHEQKIKGGRLEKILISQGYVTQDVIMAFVGTQLGIPHVSLTEIGEIPNDVVFFFFQAEDGIRYLTVTGVQTCALPI